MTFEQLKSIFSGICLSMVVDVPWCPLMVRNNLWESDFSHHSWWQVPFLQVNHLIKYLLLVIILNKTYFLVNLKNINSILIHFYWKKVISTSRCIIF